MADRASRARAAAIQDFAAVLSELRDSVGTPSFREMSGRSRAISHTTLHEAAQGYRLPSWATTVEFVKACGADPSAYRERWEHASQVIRSLSALPQAAPAGDPPGRRPDNDVAISATEVEERSAMHVAGDAAAPGPRGQRGRRGLRRYTAPGIAAVGVLAAVAVTVVLVAESRGDNPDGPGPSQKAQLFPADCPVRQTNPPAAVPAHAGDRSAFIADITVPDCSHIRRGQRVTKVWRFKNVGTVPWVGYSLHRLDLPQQRDQCQTISDVPVDDTEAGALVDIETEVTAPKSPGFCFVRFKMVDASGNIAFPGSRPVNFQIIVD